MVNVGISVLVEGIDNKRVTQFKHSIINDGQPRCSCEIYDISSEQCNMFTEYEGKKYFNRNKGHNFGIKRFINEAEVIICADVDLLIPPGFVDFSYKIAKERPFFGIMRKLGQHEELVPRKWEEWRKIGEQTTSYGCWIAMTPAQWLASGGWNEDLFSWGLDKHMWDRVHYAGMMAYRSGEYPLVHVWHPRRNKNVDFINSRMRKELHYESFLT